MEKFLNELRDATTTDEELGKSDCCRNKIGVNAKVVFGNDIEDVLNEREQYTI